MKIQDSKILAAKLARIAHDIAECDARRAELGAQQAKIWQELAEGEAVVDVRTLRKAKTPHRPVLGPVSELDRARARIALRDIEMKERDHGKK